MVTLGLVCAFVSFILLIMGLMAWGAAKLPPPEAEPEQDSSDLTTTQHGDAPQ